MNKRRIAASSGSLATQVLTYGHTVRRKLISIARSCKILDDDRVIKDIGQWSLPQP